MRWPLLATGLSLMLTLALVVLALISSRFLLQEQRQRHGEALAAQLASALRGPLENGDLLAIGASLQQLASADAASRIALYDVEDRILGEAGTGEPVDAHRYSAPVRIGSDIAGRVVVTLENSADAEGLLRYLLSLGALAILLSLLVYLLVRQLAQRLAAQLEDMADRLRLDPEASGDASGAPAASLEQATDTSRNELALLRARVEALPMSLLRAPLRDPPDPLQYRVHSVLYVHLASLSAYVSALNERNLHRYTDRLHRIIHAAAGAYGGELQVARQFGLTVCFRASPGAGPHALRAVACAQLIRNVTRELERSISLSLSVGMAVGLSETGPGNANDIYPGLYLQSVTDTLRGACQEELEHIMISPELTRAKALRGRARFHPAPHTRFLRLGTLDDAQGALLERQCALIVSRLRPQRATPA